MSENKQNITNIQLFTIVFCTLNIVFAFYQFSFFWGNHDWDWIKGVPQVLALNTGMFEGRYAKFILNILLFGGQVFPLLNTVVAFALLALGCTLLISYWQIKRKSAMIIVAMFPALSPFILGWLYFPINLLGNFSAVVLVAGGLLYAEKSGVRFKIIAGLWWLLALGVYPSALEMMIVCFCFRYILNPGKKLSHICHQAAFILTTLILFKLILIFLAKAGLIYSGHYNMQTARLIDMVKRIPEICTLTVKQLWQTVPFTPLYYKLCTLLLVVFSLFASLRNKQTVLLWFVAFASTVASAALTANPEDVAYMPRVNFYGLNFFYAGAAAVLLQQQNPWRNLGYAMSALCLFQAVNQNLYAQKVWGLGKTAEEQLVERVSSRIEQKAPIFPLVPVIAGQLPLRPRYYQEAYRQDSPYVLNAPFLIRHIPSGMFNFYAPRDYFYKQAQINGVTPALLKFLQTASRSWPANDGIYIDTVYAVILLTPEGIRAIKSQLPR